MCAVSNYAGDKYASNNNCASSDCASSRRSSNNNCANSSNANINNRANGNNCAIRNNFASSNNCASSKTTVQAAKQLCKQPNLCASSKASVHATKQLCKQQQRIFIRNTYKIQKYIMSLQKVATDRTHASMHFAASRCYYDPTGSDSLCGHALARKSANDKIWSSVAHKCEATHACTNMSEHFCKLF